MSGLYRRYLAGPLVDHFMAEPRLIRYRRACVEAVRGRVLEIGFGTGRNLPFYPDDVTAVVAVEPSTWARGRARARIAERNIDVSFVEMGGARLPLEDASFDAAVSSWTLCSIADVSVALREVARVLKPGALFHFVEHGLAPPRDEAVRKWQHRLDPLQRIVGAGCHLTRDIEAIVASSGLEIVRLDKSYMPGPRPWCFFYQGRAEAGPLSDSRLP